MWLVEGAADGDGTGVGGGDPGRVGSQVVVLLLRPSLGLDPRTVGGDLVRDPLLVPAEDRGDELGDRLGALGAAVGVSIEMRVRRARMSSRCSAPSCVTA